MTYEGAIEELQEWAGLRKALEKNKPRVIQTALDAGVGKRRIMLITGISRSTLVRYERQGDVRTPAAAPRRYRPPVSLD